MPSPKGQRLILIELQVQQVQWVSLAEMWSFGSTPGICKYERGVFEFEFEIENRVLYAESARNEREG